MISVLPLQNKPSTGLSRVATIYFTLVNTRNLPAAVLWDMDGTLVDTEPYWFAAERELVGSFGHEWTREEGSRLIGSGLWDSAAVLQAHGVTLSADQIVEWLSNRVCEHLSEGEIPWRPGAQKLLAELRESAIPTALVTMSIRSMAEKIVSRIPFLAFDVVVAGDDVEKPKPHPEAYLQAASKLGVAIEDCVAFEDSLTGLRSAVDSGAVVIGVPHLVPIPQSREHTVWTTLAGRSLADLSSLWQSQQAGGEI